MSHNNGSYYRENTDERQGERRYDSDDWQPDYSRHEEIGNSSGKRKRWVSDDDEDYNDLDHYDGASEGQDHASFKSPAEKRSRVPNEDENESGMTTYNKLTNDSKPKPMGSTSTQKVSFLEDANVLKHSADEHLRSDRLNFAAKAYMEAGILYLKHCKSLETREDRPKNKRYYKHLRATAKIFATSGKIFKKRMLWNEAILAFEAASALFLLCSRQYTSKMNIIYKTIKEQGVLKKEHRKIAFEYLNYSEDFLSSQKYFDLGQHLHRTHNICIAESHSAEENSRITLSSYLNVYQESVSLYIEKLEHHYNRLTVAGV